MRKAKRLDVARIRASTRKNLLPFFQLLYVLFAAHQYIPQNIYNYDETSLKVSSTDPAHLIATPYLPSPARAPSEFRIVATAGVCISSTGASSPSALILKDPVPSEISALREEDNLALYQSETGYINKKIFHDHMMDCVLPFIKRRLQSPRTQAAKKMMEEASSLDTPPDKPSSILFSLLPPLRDFGRPSPFPAPALAAPLGLRSRPFFLLPSTPPTSSPSPASTSPSIPGEPAPLPPSAEAADQPLSSASFSWQEFYDFLRQAPIPDGLVTPPTDAPHEPRALLLLDGRSTRLAPDVWKAFAAAGIDVVCLPAHTSHLVQPLDRYVNAEFKRQLRRLKRAPGKRQQAVGLPAMLARIALALRRATDSELAAMSFAASGIVPLDPAQVLADLPLDCESIAAATPARAQHARRNINGKILTAPATIALMLGDTPATTDEPDIEEELQTDSPGGEMVVDVDDVPDEAADRDEDLPQDDVAHPQELTDEMHDQVITSWRDQQVILVEDSEDEQRSRGERKRRPQDDEDSEEEYDMEPKKKKHSIPSPDCSPPRQPPRRRGKKRMSEDDEEE
jgi:hypothetical protein